MERHDAPAKVGEEGPTDLGRRGLVSLLGLFGGAAALAACGRGAEADEREPVGTAAGAIVYAAPVVVDTIAALAALDGNDGNLVIVEGYHSRGDRGGGTFLWQAGARPNWPGTSTQIPSDGGVLVVSTKSNPSTGYWLRVDAGPFNVLWFGARAEDMSASGKTVTTTAIQAAIDAAAYSHSGLAGGAFNPENHARGGEVLFPKGRFHINATLLLDATRYGGALEGVTLHGVAGNQSNSIATLVWGGASASPMLMVVGAVACRVERLGFYACMATPYASQCIHVTTYNGTDERTVSNFTIRECAFSGADKDNVLLGDPEGSVARGQDIQNTTIEGCSFMPSGFEVGGPQTIAHIRQRGGNIVATVVRECRMNGNMTKAAAQTLSVGCYFPLHAIKVQSGWIRCYGINAAAIGWCDIYADSPGTGNYAASIEVFGWDSQSMNFFASNITDGALGVLPLVLHGVHHSDVYVAGSGPPALPQTFPSFVAPQVLPTPPMTYRFSIDFNNTSGQSLTLSGCVLTRDVALRAVDVNASLHGVTFFGVVPGTYARYYGVVEAVANALRATEGAWLEGTNRRSRLPRGDVLLNSSTAGVNQIEGKLLVLAAYGTAGDTVTIGGAGLCGFLFVVRSSGSGSVGGVAYLASALNPKVSVTTDPFASLSNADTAAVNNKLNIFWDGTNFKVRNGLASASYVRLSLVGFGVV